MTEPVHDHDCKRCQFVGSEAPELHEPLTNQVDMYVCDDHAGRVTLIRRFGSDGPSYAATDPRPNLPAKYQRVLNAYRSLES